MPNPTVKISIRSRQTLKTHADAIEEERRRRFVADANASYTALKADLKAWSEVEAERSAWDATLLDGVPTLTASKRRRS